MVHLLVEAVDMRFLERLCREVGTVPVALRHLRTRQTQFANNALRQQVTIGVEYQRTEVIKRSTDRYIVVCLRGVYPKICRVHGELRRTVTVYNASRDIGYGCHLLAAHAHVFEVEFLLAGAKQLSQLCGVAAAVDMVLRQILTQQGDVHAHAFGQDKHNAAHCQHGVEVLHRRVERKVAVARNAAVPVEPPLAADEMHEVEQCLVLNHHSLGLSG